MTDSNRLRMTVIRETSLGVTPTPSPRMRTARITGESLQFVPQFVNSEELRDDRMNADPIKVNEQNQGGINWELSYPVDESPESEFIRSLAFNAWQNTPQRLNDGTADSVITDVADTTDVVTVTTGAAFAENHLVLMSGFASAENNGVFKVTTGSATVPAMLGAGFVAEAAPAATARMKVVGAEGDLGDITALADGLGSTDLDFRTLGLAAGQWIKIGGTADASTFAFLVTAGAAARANAWARVTAIAENKLTLDNLPSGWTTDTGTSKTIRIFFGDQIKNGVTMSSLTIERGFMGQAVPTYIAQRGMVVGQGDFNWNTEQIVTGSWNMQGLTGAQDTTPLDATPDAASSSRVMSANVNVGRIAESGVPISAPNWIQSATVSINNNLRIKTAVGALGGVDIGVGDVGVTGTLQSYFGSNALLAKLLAGTVGNINLRTAKDGQALIMAIPRVTFTNGSPSAGGRNQDVMLPLEFMASKDPLTAAHFVYDRLDYFEA
ncbi:MAG: phage tail tube protein [Rhizobiaceae bacterium]|nr:phage tail tube protein [Rhizobiaceae bacterium]